MAAASFSVMKETMRSMTGRPASELTQMGDSLVAAIRFYERKRFWFNETYTEALVLGMGDDSFTLPENFKKEFLIRALVDGKWRSNGKGLELVTFEKLKQDFVDPNDAGYPRACAVLGNTVYVDRVADGSYPFSLGYVYGDALLPQADSDTSIWFDEPRLLTLYKALEIFYRDYKHDFNKGAAYKQQAIDWLGNVQGDSNTRQTEWELE